ncbi:MAG: fibronectin type III domain-containing protein, partial [Fibrobacterota bacterium]|nr:fibronectin type III domain-containing protein [Fibrobacterota bacterium]
TDKTIYHFAAFVKDSSGNYSPAGANARDSARTPDVTPPANVTALAADGITPTTASLAWTPSASADADTVMIRYLTGVVHPATANDGTLWKKLPNARDKDTITGLVANSIYAFSLFVRDSAGNYGPGVAGARDTSLYQLPVTGSLAINDLSGRTNDGDPALAFTSSGADSLRFGLLADTALSAWKEIRTLDSLGLGTVDGNKFVAAQFKNVYGKRSVWYRDTTLLDRTPPMVTLDLKAVHSRWTWPVSVSGTSKDSLAGTDRVFVVRKRLADGAHFNGSSWVGSPDTAKLILSPGDTLFGAILPATSMTTGEYRFTARALDLAGNMSAPLSMDVHYDENRLPALAFTNLKDTVMQNDSISWKLDFGDMDAGDSLILVSLIAPAWLTVAPGADSSYPPWALHKIPTLKGRPLQFHVGSGSENTVRAVVQDRSGLNFTYTKSIHVVDVNDPPVFAGDPTVFSIKEDSVSRWTPKFKDADPRDGHTMTLVTFPAFATLDSLTLVLKPGSRDVGNHPFKIAVSDGALLDTLDVTVSVANVNDAPVAFPSSNWQSPAFWKEDVTDSFTVVVVDMDRSDPVVLTTTLPPWLTQKSTVDPADPYNRFFRFAARPGQADTGSFSFKLRFQDAAGAASELPLTAKVAAVNDIPSAVIKGRQIHAGAARISFDVTDNDGDAGSTRFHYRLVGAAGDTVRKGICATTVLDLHPLADGDYRLAVAAEDEGGLRQAGFTQTDLRIAGATTLVLDSAKWYMIAFPGRTLPAGALGAGVALTTWDEASSDGSPLGRYAAGNAADSLVGGKGYWVRVAERVNLSSPLASLLDNPHTMKLSRGKQGWNQVGNPFPYFVDLSPTGLQFWEWDADRRDLVNVRGILKPWGAYWVQVKKDTVLIVKDIPWFPTGDGGIGAGGPLAKNGVSGEPTFRSRGEWTLQMSLQAGPYQDRANFLGIRNVTEPAASRTPAPDAESAADDLIPDAPKFGDYIALHFEKPGISAADSQAQGYASDFRDRMGEEEEWWDFSVENSESGFQTAILSLPGLHALMATGLHAFL